MGPARDRNRPRRPPHARSGSWQGPNRCRQRWRRASGARGAFGGQRCRAEVASRAPLQHLTPVQSRLREIDAVGLVVCPRGGSRWSGADLLVVQGHAGGSRSGGGVSHVLTQTPIDVLDS